MKEGIMKVLELLEVGKVNPQEAESLINAIKDGKHKEHHCKHKEHGNLSEKFSKVGEGVEGFAKVVGEKAEKAAKEAKPILKKVGEKAGIAAEEIAEKAGMAAESFAEKAKNINFTKKDKEVKKDDLKEDLDDEVTDEDFVDSVVIKPTDDQEDNK